MYTGNIKYTEIDQYIQTVILCTKTGMYYDTTRGRYNTGSGIQSSTQAASQ